MFEDLVETCQQLQQMLADVQENHTDFHPDDIAEMLRNCGLKAQELGQAIAARRQYVVELTPYWKVTQSGADAGMPPAGGTPAVPPVTREGPGII